MNHMNNKLRYKLYINFIIYEVFSQKNQSPQPVLTFLFNNDSVPPKVIGSNLSIRKMLLTLLSKIFFGTYVFKKINSSH